jgi:hypothetical protein
VASKDKEILTNPACSMVANDLATIVKEDYVEAVKPF